MTSPDYIVLTLYLIGTLAVGLYFSRRNHSAKDMFAAGGSSPWWVSGLSSFMTMFSAGTFVVWGGIAYSQGLVAVSINIMFGFAALGAGYFVAGRWNELGVTTPAEYLALRFGENAVHLYTWVLMLFRLVTTAVALYSLAIIVSAIMPVPEGFWFQQGDGNISVVFLIVVFGLAAVIYTTIGGLWAVLMTDVLQFIILNLTVLFIIVLLLIDLPNYNITAANIPEGFLALTQSPYTAFFLIGWGITQFFMIGAEWAFVQRSLSVATPSDARKVNYLFGALYLISPMIWLAPPMLLRLIDPNVNPEQAYILAGQRVLPEGATGLLVAAMFSATASMVSSQLNVFSGVLTFDIVKRFWLKAASDAKLVGIGRLITLVFGLILIVLASLVPQMGGAEKVVISVTSLIVGPMMAPTIWSLFSKALRFKHVVIEVIICAAIGIIIKLWIPAMNGAEGSSIAALQQWLVANTKMVDIFIGVVCPVAVLTLLTLGTKPVADGWQRVREQVANRPEATESDDMDATPAKVVSIALILCAITLFGLIPINSSQPTALAVFATIVTALGAAGLWFTRDRAY